MRDRYDRVTRRRHGQAWPQDLPDDLPDDLASDLSAAVADAPAAKITPGMFDVALVARLLIAAARETRALSYSELLGALGYRFNRPKMRALCKVLDAIDRTGADRGEPELAVLVVREGDRLPGQGWWVGRTDYAGSWEGADARAHVARLQRAAFDYWADI